jgi:hypothetical protein
MRENRPESALVGCSIRRSTGPASPRLGAGFLVLVGGRAKPEHREDEQLDAVEPWVELGLHRRRAQVADAARHPVGGEDLERAAVSAISGTSVGDLRSAERSLLKQILDEVVDRAVLHAQRAGRGTTTIG